MSDKAAKLPYICTKLQKKNKTMKSDYQNKIVDRVRKLRIEHKVSQEELASILQLSGGHIGNIESPKMSHKYTLKQLYLICKEFDLPIEQLFLEDSDYAEPIDIISNLIQKIIQYEA